MRDCLALAVYAEKTASAVLSVRSHLSETLTAFDSKTGYFRRLQHNASSNHSFIPLLVFDSHGPHPEKPFETAQNHHPESQITNLFLETHRLPSNFAQKQTSLTNAQPSLILSNPAAPHLGSILRNPNQPTDA